MRYVTTLNNVSRIDSDKLGFRASDLGVLKEKGFNVPLSFVINNEAFEEFLAANGLKAKIERAILEKDPDAEIQNLFSRAAIPKEIEEEILEAYESLTIEAGTTAHSIVSEFNYPFVMLIRSPSYLLETEDEEGIYQNVKGAEAFLAALKNVWASYYSTASMAYRRKHALSVKFSAAVIVEKMKKTKASAIAYSRSDFDEFLVVVKTFKGMPDFGTQLAGKDYFEVDHNTLQVKKSQVNVQEHEITRDIDTGRLVQRPLLQEAGRQKVNDKIISEIARITKRSKSFIGKDVKIHFGIMDDYIYVLQATRMLFQPKTRIEEEDEIVVREDSSGTKVTQEHTLTVEQTDDSKLVLPGILSKDEAKEEVLKTAPDKVFSLTGFDEEIQPETITEEEIKKEETLLDQVLKMKEMLELMESHALTGNHEAYDQEKKRLRELMEQASR